MTVPIPPLQRRALLPSPELSVSEFLRFPLPTQDATQVQDVSSFWCTEEPNVVAPITLEDLKDLPIPSPSVLKSLCNHPGTGLSICYPHIYSPTHMRYPLWILTYWVEVEYLRHHVRQPWAKAEMFLSKQRLWYNSPSLRKLCSTTQGIFLRLPWAGNVNGFTEPDPRMKLATYLSHD